MLTLYILFYQPEMGPFSLEHLKFEMIFIHDSLTTNDVWLLIINRDERALACIWCQERLTKPRINTNSSLNTVT